MGSVLCTRSTRKIKGMVLEDPERGRRIYKGYMHVILNRCESV